MNEITITVSNNVAKGDGTLYVCGNSDYRIRFVFDAEWENYPNKTARFVKEGGKYTDVLFQGDLCPVPVLLGTGWIYIGVFAGELKTTTPARVLTKRSILDLGGIPEEPAPDVYSQIMERLNDLEVGTGLPAGGAPGQALLKQSEADGDAAWQDLPKVEKTSQLENDSGFITGYTETDPTVPAWAKEASKPAYTKSEVGLGNVENVKQYSASNPPPYPVTSVNGQTGAVVIEASGESVPSYVAEEASAVVDKALSHDDSRVFRFIAFTDAHQNNDNTDNSNGNRDAGYGMAELHRLIGLDLTTFLGDSCWGSSSNTIAVTLEQAKQFNRYFGKLLSRIIENTQGTGTGADRSLPAPGSGW